MSAKTKILFTEEIKQSNIETKTYDEFAQFYEYGETEKTEILTENAKYSGKRNFVTLSLAIFGGLFLFAGLGVGFYYLSEKMFQTNTVNQIGVKNLPKDENSNNGFGADRNAENGIEAEKLFKAKVSEEKNLSETPVKKDVSNPSETKTVKTVEQTDKNPLTVQSPKESTKTNEPIKTNEMPKNPTDPSKTFVPKDTKREFWTSSPAEKTSQNSPSSNQNQNDSIKQNRYEKFRDFPKNRQEFLAKKIKQSTPEQRSKIRERFQRRKN